jgi:DinB superfamily
MDARQPLRDHLVKLLHWEDAHCGFDKAVDGLLAKMRGVTPTGLPYSAWQLVEHIRITQRDILDFCRDPKYTEKTWPDEYWPKKPEPPSDTAWDASLAAVRRDCDELSRLAADSKVNLFAPVPAGDGQTFLREVLLAADHMAYHVGQIVYVRRILGAWD